MTRFFAIALALCGGCGSAASAGSIFESEQSALSAVADLGPEWRDQTAPPQDFNSPGKKRRFFYSKERAAEIEWNAGGDIDQITFYDPACYPTGRKEAFSTLLRHVDGDKENLPTLVSAAEHVFDANWLPAIRVAVAPQMLIVLMRSSKRYGCRIALYRNPQRAI